MQYRTKVNGYCIYNFVQTALAFQKDITQGERKERERDRERERDGEKEISISFYHE